MCGPLVPETALLTLAGFMSLARLMSLPRFVALAGFLALAGLLTLSKRLFGLSIRDGASNLFGGGFR